MALDRASWLPQGSGAASFVPAMQKQIPRNSNYSAGPKTGDAQVARATARLSGTQIVLLTGPDVQGPPSQTKNLWLGAVVLWLLVNGLFFYVTRINTRALSPRWAEALIIGGQSWRIPDRRIAPEVAAELLVAVAGLERTVKVLADRNLA